MKTRDRVPAALAAPEVKAVIEQARRRQRRRRRVIALELLTVVAVGLAVMPIARGGNWGPFAAQAGKRPADAGAAARPALSGQAPVAFTIHLCPT